MRDDISVTDQDNGSDPAGMTDEGLLALINPADPELDTDSEDDDAFETISEDMSPGESQRVLDTMRPLSEDEAEILDDLPEISDLKRVDDAEQSDWLNNLTRKGYKAMDAVLDDASYGETMDAKEMSRQDGSDDVGFGIPGLSSVKKGLRGAYKYGKKGITAPLSLTKRLVKKFVPSRDAAKAKVVKNLYAKLVREHANFLANQDQAAGRAVQPRAYYVNQSKPWAVAQIARGGLPTKFAVSGSDVLGSEICGSDVMGNWWNPLSWFFGQSQVVVNNTQGERSPTGPDGQPTDPSADPSADPSMLNPGADPSMTAPSADPSAAYADQDPGYADPSAYSQGDTMLDRASRDPMTGISGDDSLGAFATEILSGAAPSRSAAPNTKEAQMLQVAVHKLRSGYPIMPGELAVIASLAAGGNPRAKKLYALLQKGGVSNPTAPATSSGAWLHKLNPGYWFMPAEERALKDKEVDAWKQNAELQKKLGKRQEVLAQAEKAKSASDAVKAAQEQAAATEAQLKAIETEVKGHLVEPARSSSSGTFVGHEKPTEISKVIQSALARAGKLERAKAIYAKIMAGKSLDDGEARDAREVAKILEKVKVVHGDLYQQAPYYLSAVHGAFVGGAMLRGLGVAREKNQICGKAAAVLGKRLDGQSLSPADEKALLALGQKTSDLRQVVLAHASGKLCAGLDGSKKLHKAVACGAASAMTPAEAKMLEALRKLAKAGNPRAVEGLRLLQSTGAVVGGDHVGSMISDTFKYATAPIWLPAKQLYKGAKWTGQKLGVVSKGSSSPEQQRLAMIRAAAARRKAAEARAAAADAQTEAELRAQQAIAAAADADADAADAEALSKEAAMRTREVEADPSLAQQSDDDSGSFVGSWEAFVGADAKKVVARAKGKDATGIKIRAGASMYQKIKAGDPKAKAALKTMVAKSQKGDPQATRDLRVVYAGMIATRAKQQAQKKQAKAAAAKARKLKVVAFQRRVEAAAANKLLRTERKLELHHLSVVKRKAAKGDPKAKAYVAKQVELARRGDEKATVRVGKIRLVRDLRKQAPTARERRNLAVAGKVLARAQKGDRKAVRQVLLVQAAAKAGNPNAKRAVKRLQTAKVVAAVIATGTAAGVVLAAQKQHKMTKAEAQAKVASAKAKMKAKSGSREEYAAGARAAQALGDKQTAGILAVEASQAPSATETIKKTAAVVAAKEAGNPEAKAAINKSFEEAKAGDAGEIKKMGNVVAAQTIADVQAGRPVPPAMRDAINLQERIAEKDPAAVAEAKRITEAATSESPVPEATAAAITLAAAAVTAKALAAKPQARREFMAKVNPPLPPADQSKAEATLAEYRKQAAEGTISPDDSQVAVRLAERLNQPKVAAEIAAYAPAPESTSNAMSTLNNDSLPPIRTFGEMLVESLKAITLSTRDPMANYRQGVQTSRKVGQEFIPGKVTITPGSPSDFIPGKVTITPGEPIPYGETSTQSKVSVHVSKPWLHKLKPSYWFKSPEEKMLIDQEILYWKQNAELNRLIQNRSVLMAQAERSGAASASAKAARAQVEALNERIASLQNSISVSGMGWSPFTWFRQNLAVIAPSTALAASAASLASSLQQRAGAKSAPRQAPASPAPAPVPAPAAAVQKAQAEAPTPAEETSSGDKAASSGNATSSPPVDREKILLNISASVRRLLSKSAASDHVRSSVTPEAAQVAVTNPGKTAALVYAITVADDGSVSVSRTVQTRKDKAVSTLAANKPAPDAVTTIINDVSRFVASKKWKEAVDKSPAPTATSGDAKSPSFRDYVTSALQSKAISRRDFNRAVEIQAGASATTQVKEAVAKKTLDFLTQKGVKIGT